MNRRLLLACRYVSYTNIRGMLESSKGFANRALSIGPRLAGPRLGFTMQAKDIKTCKVSVWLKHRRVQVRDSLIVVTTVLFEATRLSRYKHYAHVASSVMLSFTKLRCSGTRCETSRRPKQMSALEHEGRKRRWVRKLQHSTKTSETCNRYRAAPCTFRPL